MENILKRVILTGTDFVCYDNPLEIYIDEEDLTTHNYADNLVPIINKKIEVYVYGSIEVKKRLVSRSGEDLPLTNAEFYVALFTDKSRTNRVSDVKTISFINSSSSKVTFENLELNTYYVSEVDRTGEPIDTGTTKGGGIFAARYADGNRVDLTEEDTYMVIEFENIFTELPRDY